MGRMIYSKYDEPKKAKIVIATEHTPPKKKEKDYEQQK